ncbi:MAG: DUF3606 domain-containing protein [Ramlibacter sp.]
MTDHNNRINIFRDSELQEWAASLNSTPERVRLAVLAVGDGAAEVRRFLGQSRRA